MLVTGRTCTRRAALKLLGAAAAAAFSRGAVHAAAVPMLQRPIPSSGETIPAIGMGTWQTFNVGSDRQLRMARTEVLEAMFAHGGGVVDCSPMYGSAADVLGFAVAHMHENMRAGRGPIPDADLRERMARHVEAL